MKKKTDYYALAVKLFPQAAEIKLEYDLAALMYPNYTISYDENGHYWKMNDTRFPMPNFKGYVPHWLRNDDDSFALMVQESLYPFERHSRDGISMCALRTNEDLDIYVPIEREQDEKPLPAKRRATRIAILKAAIVRFNEKPMDCVLDSL